MSQSSRTFPNNFLRKIHNSSVDFSSELNAIIDQQRQKAFPTCRFRGESTRATERNDSRPVKMTALALCASRISRRRRRWLIDKQGKKGEKKREERKEAEGLHESMGTAVQAKKLASRSRGNRADTRHRRQVTASTSRQVEDERLKRGSAGKDSRSCRDFHGNSNRSACSAVEQNVGEERKEK